MPYDGLSYSYLTAIRGSPGNRCLNHIPSYSRVCSQLHVSLLKLWLFLVHSSNVCFLNAVILIFGCSPIPDFWSQDYIHRHAVICDAVRVRTKCVCIYRIYIYIYIYMCTDIRVCILYTYIIYNVYIYIYTYVYVYIIHIHMLSLYVWYVCVHTHDTCQFCLVIEHISISQQRRAPDCIIVSDLDNMEVGAGLAP